MSTTGREVPDLELPDRTVVMLVIGPAPISAASAVSMLVRAAPVSDLATTRSVREVPETSTSSV